MLPVNAFVKIRILYHIPFPIANKNLKKWFSGTEYVMLMLYNI